MLRIEDLVVSYDIPGGTPLKVLDGLSLEVRRGELISFIGPSGCGKTTLLHAAAGLLEPGGGRIERGGAQTAMVFQRPTLMPWRTVLDNTLFGVECLGALTAEDRGRAARLLGRMRLTDHTQDHPHQLSEGMKQRVNLARALMVSPDVLLLDEPFSSLDVTSRRRLQDDLLARWAEDDLTVVLVSHSLEEVVYMSDRIVVLSEKPTRCTAVITVDLPRPRAVGRAGRLALLEVVDELEAAMGGLCDTA